MVKDSHLQVALPRDETITRLFRCGSECRLHRGLKLSAAGQNVEAFCCWNDRQKPDKRSDLSQEPLRMDFGHSTMLSRTG